MHNCTRNDFLADLAHQLEELETPFNARWVREKMVGTDEIEATSQHAALIIRGYLALSPEDQIAFVTGGVFVRRPIQKPDQVGPK